MFPWLKGWGRVEVYFTLVVSNLSEVHGVWGYIG